MEFNYNRLKAERIARGLKPQDMADALGVTKETYWKKESGRAGLTVKDLGIISKKLGIEDLTIFFDLKVS